MWSVAHDAHVALRATGRNQAIVISGDSGAGAWLPGSVDTRFTEVCRTIRVGVESTHMDTLVVAPRLVARMP